MGKTYRREKDYWDDDPVRFERRSTKHFKKESSYQEKRRDKNKIIEDYYNNEDVTDASVYTRK